MPAKIRQSEQVDSPVSQLAGWARQGIDTFMAAQKILLDLAAQQNALVIGMVREGLSRPRVRPGDAIAKIADDTVQNLTNMGKILLDLVVGETELVVDGVKEAVPLPVAANTLANLLRHRLVTFLDMEKRLLEAAAEQTHAAAESYQEGKGLLAAGASMAELARRGIESIVETEKQFLDLAADEVTAATEGDGNGRKPAAGLYKVLTHLAREGGEKYIDAQKQLLHLAVEQMESVGKAAGKRAEAPRGEARAALGDLTEKSVRNLVEAEKSLMDLVAKPAKTTPKVRKRKAPRVRPKPPVEDLGESETA